jgi:ketosteroid isomerase-like protein
MRTFLVLCGLAALAGCQSAPAPPDTRAADAETIHQIEVQWSKDSEAHLIEPMMSHYANDAVEYSPNSPVLRGKDAIRKGWTESFALPGFSLTWMPEKVEVAKSGELAYSRGPFVVKQTGKDGKPTERHGSYLTVWKKQADGTWKVIEDIGTNAAAH